MILRFADCLIDTTRHCLLRGGREIHVQPQVFDLLCLLADEAPSLVTRDRMIEVVWGGRIVSESAMSARIAAARTAVGDDGQRQAVIRTVARRGLQLAVPVVREGVDPPPATGPVAGARADHRPAEPDRLHIRFAVSTDSARIAWAASGAGPPLLRAGHWLSHLEMDWESPIWRPLLDRLGMGHRLLRYDQRGTGLSARDPASDDLDHFVSDMLAVCDAARADKVSIFAASQSVPVAVRFAANYPQRVSRMVLYGGFCTGSYATGDPADAARADSLLNMIREGWGNPQSAFMRAMSTLFAPGATSEELDNLVAMQLNTVSPNGAARLRRAIGHFDIGDDLARVRAPVLVIHARNDAVQPFEQGLTLAARIPGAEFLPIDSNNHIALPSDPAWEKLVSAATGFLRG